MPRFSIWMPVLIFFSCGACGLVENAVNDAVNDTTGSIAEDIADGVTEAVSDATTTTNNSNGGDTGSGGPTPQPEICGDNIDNDLDGVIDNGCDLSVDNDGDGFSENDGDCNDAEITAFPGATEVTGNTIDEDCDGIALDQDGDGVTATTIGGVDCNDLNATVFPGATEIKDDDLDSDCDGIQVWSFTKTYNDVIDKRCSCHQSSGAPHGLNMSTKSLARQNLVNVSSAEFPAMDRVEPGDADNSYVVHKLEGTQASVGGSGSRMPKSGGPLSSQQITEIRDWIDRGAIDD
ncbi:MAG: hypothetical protein D6761_13940 [Candidatus Dadabacteria bacterium]|nr:MAG: hypothetical protein D6761_13940 [Candidatus Dadabacteria bacterium]